MFFVEDNEYTESIIDVEMVPVTTLPSLKDPRRRPELDEWFESVVVGAAGNLETVQCVVTNAVSQTNPVDGDAVKVQLSHDLQQHSQPEVSNQQLVEASLFIWVLRMKVLITKLRDSRIIWVARQCVEKLVRVAVAINLW